MCLVSVIMSTYKEEEIFLRQAIESILNQTYKDFEYIIILDNPDNNLHIRIRALNDASEVITVGWMLMIFRSINV